MELTLNPNHKPREQHLCFPTWIYSCRSGGTVSCALPFTTNVTISTPISQTFLFLSSNILSSPTYGVFMSQLIRYARACSSYVCFILRAVRLSCKLVGQGYVRERLKSSLQEVLWSIWRSHQTLCSLPLPNVTWHSGTWSYTVTSSIHQAVH